MVQQVQLRDFNSKAVQLKALQAFKLLVPIPVFQFQSGSIKSGMTKETYLPHCNFNSKAVQLKVFWLWVTP